MAPSLRLIFTFAFWASAGAVVYAYALYPLVLTALARAFGRRAAAPQAASDADLPAVTLLIAAHDEEDVIGARLENALSLDYPAGKLQVLIASDGSTDGTAAVVRRYASRGVRLLDFQVNRGKASALNDAMRQVQTPVVLLSDANTCIEPSAARSLARWFADPRVGAVCGRLVITDPGSGKNVDGVYWKYETYLKKREGELGALLGSNGAIYAIRHDLFLPIPANTIVDDFVIPLLAKQRSGCRIVYDCEAVAHEQSAPDMAAEFKRRVRIGAGGFQAIGMLWRLLNPTAGWVAFTFLSHKVLRWLCPIIMIIAAASCMVLSVELESYRWLLAAQLSFYGAAWLGTRIPDGSPFTKPLRIAAMFASMNAALLVGFFRWLRGRQGGTWKRTRRASGEVAAVAGHGPAPLVVASRGEVGG